MRNASDRTMPKKAYAKCVPNETVSHKKLVKEVTEHLRFFPHGNTWLVQIGYLMLFAVAALIIGLFVRKPFIGLNAFVEEKLEESELF